MNPHKKNNLSPSGIIAFLLTLLFLSLVLTSCQKPEETGSIIGRVVLVNDSGDPGNDPVDMANVTVALYNLAEIDTTLARITGEYPQIGVQITQAGEFDHRLANPVRTCVSDASGSFELDKIDPGQYNLVLIKENWGVRYLLGINVEEGEACDVGDTELYPSVTVTTTSQDLVFQSDHTYLVEDNISLIGAVDLQPRTQIFCNPGTKISFFGNLTTPDTSDMDEAWKITSSVNLYSTTAMQFSADDYLWATEFVGQNFVIRNGIFRFVNTAIVLRSSYSEIRDVLIRYCAEGISMFEGITSISNSLISNGSRTAIGLNSSALGQQTISHSIIHKFSDGVIAVLLGTYDINNCYLSQLSNQAIKANMCSGSITHNAFEQNLYDIFLSAVSTNIPQIADNDFFRSRFVGIWPNRNAILHNNNFYKTDHYFISIRSENPSTGYTIVDEDFDATNNYWGVQDIDSYLLDAGDNGEYPGEPCPYHIIYLPKRSTPFPDAGIQ